MADGDTTKKSEEHWVTSFAVEKLLLPSQA